MTAGRIHNFSMWERKRGGGKEKFVVALAKKKNNTKKTHNSPKFSLARVAKIKRKNTTRSALAAHMKHEDDEYTFYARRVSRVPKSIIRLRDIPHSTWTQDSLIFKIRRCFLFFSSHQPITHRIHRASRPRAFRWISGSVEFSLIFIFSSFFFRLTFHHLFSAHTCARDEKSNVTEWKRFLSHNFL